LLKTFAVAKKNIVYHSFQVISSIVISHHENELARTVCYKKAANRIRNLTRN